MWIRYTLIAVVAFAIGQLDPLGWAYWQAAGWKLPEIKAESLSGPSPFEKISPDKWIAETEHAFAIEDKYPQAPVHMLVVSKERYETILDVPPEVRGEMLNLAVRMAQERGIDASGFRLTINTNPQGAQTVYHVHIHVIGGRQMHYIG